jgi:hypothetical protein
MLNNSSVRQYDTFGAVTKEQSKKKWWYGIIAVVLLALVAGALYWNMEQQPRTVVRIQAGKKLVEVGSMLEQMGHGADLAASAEVSEDSLPSLKKPTTTSSVKVAAKDATAEQVVEAVVDSLKTADDLITTVEDVVQGVEVVASGQAPGVSDVKSALELAEEVADTVLEVMQTVTEIADIVE